MEEVAPPKKKAWRYTLIALGALLLMAYVLVLLPNQGKDEPLREEWRAFMEAKPMAVPDGDNIYVAMAGFDAAEGENIFETGRRWMDKKEKDFAQDEREEEEEEKWEEWARAEASKALRWQKATPPFECHDRSGRDFLECAHLQEAHLEAELSANETLLERYAVLQKLPLYVAPAFPDPWNVITIFELHKRLATAALLEAEGGDAEAGLAFFKEDMALWRRALEGKRDGLLTVVAAFALSNNLDMLSLLLSLPSTKLEGQASAWRELLAPLSQEQLNMRPVVEAELRLLHYVVRLFGKENGHVFLPNALMNGGAPFFNAWLKLSTLPWEDYMQQREEALALWDTLSKPQRHWVYNPVGKWLFSKALRLVLNEGHWDNVIRGLHKSDAHLRMVRLQLELRIASMPSEDIPAFLAQQNPAYCAPCTDFSWDVETRKLSFQSWLEDRLEFYLPAVYLP